MDMSVDPREERIGKLRSYLEGEYVDSFLVTDPLNVRYLTGFTGSAGMILVTAASCVLFTDFRYREQAALELDGTQVELLIYENDMLEEVSEYALGAGAGRLGFEGENLSAWSLESLRRHLENRVLLVLTRSVVERLRAIKTDGEVRPVRRAADLVGEVLDELKEEISTGISERSVAAEIVYRLKNKGAEGVPFEPVVAFGPHGSMPHARSTTASLEEGMSILIDLGAVVEGYCCDVTRTFAQGPPGGRFEEIYEAVREAQEAALSFIEDGVPCSEVDGVARRVLDEKGLGGLFGHGLGHGVGLDVHEKPTIGRTSEDVLRKGMVFTVEPGVYIEGWGGIRLEDTVLLTGGGPRVLSDFLRSGIPVIGK